MDAITLLRDDHKRVKELFDKYDKLGAGATASKERIVSKIIEELTVHANVEEQIFYPAVRQAVERADDVVLESLEEHNLVEHLLADLVKMHPDAERFDSKVRVLITNVRHHIKEEENELFPKVREDMGRSQLQELGEAMQKAKKFAPTRPHPHSPQQPPGNVIIGTMFGLVDRGRTIGREALQKVLSR